MLKSLGKYLLVAELAQGGMGNVYLAMARGPGRFHKLVVIKELRPELVEDADFVAMFLEEARLAARLQHPNVVQTYEVGGEESRPFLVMEHLDGRSLAQLSRLRDPSFTMEMKLRIVAEALRGLEYAHALQDYDGTPLGLVHRDVTPQNIFLTFDGQAKLLDFGIAKAHDTSLVTSTGTVKGKPAYMSPEQIQGQSSVQCDVFAAGVVLWESVTGRRMWSKRSDTEILTALLQHKLPSLTEAAPGVDPALQQLIESALAPLESRTRSVRQLREQLESWLRQHDAPGISAIGEVIAAMFAHERREERQRIEQAMNDVERGVVRERLPTVSSERTEGTPSGSLRTESLSAATPAVMSQPNQASPRRWPLATATGGLLVLGALLALGWSSRQSPAPGSTSQLAPSEPVASVPSAPAVSASASALAPASAVASAPAPAPVPAASTPSPETSAARVARGRRAAPGAEATPVVGKATATATLNCSPPFYFEGTKKIFKPGCF